MNRGVADQPSPPTWREPEPSEFVPPDYFRRLEGHELPGGGGPLEVDLGCGDGSFLVEMARQFPDRRFLGVERLLGRVRKVSRKLQREGLENAQVLRLESRYTVEWLLPENSVSRLHLLCPDPWPKARHHRRRLLQPEFLAAVAAVLEPGGEFLFKTDNDEYFEWALEQFEACASLVEEEWPDDAFFYPLTDFERQWLAEGRTIRRIRLRRRVGDNAGQHGLAQ